MRQLTIGRAAAIPSCASLGGGSHSPVPGPISMSFLEHYLAITPPMGRIDGALFPRANKSGGRADRGRAERPCLNCATVTNSLSSARHTLRRTAPTKLNG